MQRASRAGEARLGIANGGHIEKGERWQAIGSYLWARLNRAVDETTRSPESNDSGEAAQPGTLRAPETVAADRQSG